MRRCSVPECGRRHCAKGYCNSHYANWRRGGGAVPTRLRSGCWSDDEIARLREVYASAPPLRAADLAAELARTVEAVHLKASRLGLGNWHRPKVVEKKRRRMFDSDEERRAHVSASRKAWIAANGHPRGALGMKHSPEAREKVAAANRRAWADPTSGHNTEKAAQRRSDEILKRIAAGGMRSGYTRSAGGRRADLGDRYFRSAWEANYARYLNLMVRLKKITSWRYEPKVFWFETIKRGARSYQPDFLVTYPDGSHEWHEVKGWMDPKSKTKLARMAKFFPQERVIIIGESWFRQAKRGGLAASLPEWESQGRGSRGC